MRVSVWQEGYVGGRTKGHAMPMPPPRPPMMSEVKLDHLVKVNSVFSFLHACCMAFQPWTFLLVGFTMKLYLEKYS